MAGYLSYMASFQESEAVLQVVKDKAAYYTDERWQYYIFESLKDVQQFMSQKPLLHIISWNVNERKSLESLMKIRENGKDALLLIVASPQLSPVEYLRPSIAPAALLLQPLSAEKIQRALDEVFCEFEKKFGKETSENIFYIEGRDEKIRIPVHQIDYFEAREGKVFVRTGREEYGFYSTLDKIENTLPNCFLRCHRSYIVNMNCVKTIDYANQVILLKNDAQILISRRCTKVVKEYQDGR